MKYLQIHKNNFNVFMNAQNTINNNLKFYIKNRLLFEKAIIYNNTYNIDSYIDIELNIDIVSTIDTMSTFSENFENDYDCLSTYDNINNILDNENLFIYGPKNNIVLQSIEWLKLVKYK
jgi:hypothetical protein